MPDLNPIAALPLLSVLLVFLFSYSSGKKKYSAYVSVLDAKEYGLRAFMVIGFDIMDRTKYGYGNHLDRRLRKNLRELYEPEYVEFYLRVTWAGAVTYAFIGLFITGLVAIVMEGNIGACLGGVAFSGFLGYASLVNTDQKVKARHLQVAMDLPDLTNQILILSGAGLTLRAALIMISNEIKGEGPLYSALQRAVIKLEHGSTDEEAMDVLTTSCNMPEMRRLVSVLLQNMQRGGTDVLLALREIGRELWEGRKAAAKRMAEETGTKMLFPMMLMLVAVILLMAAPAAMSMMGGI